MPTETKILCKRVSGYIQPFCHVQHGTTSKIHWLLLQKGKCCWVGFPAWITRGITVNSLMVDHGLWCNPAKRWLLVQLRKEMIHKYWIGSRDASPALLASAKQQPQPSCPHCPWGSARTWCFSCPGTQEGGLQLSKGTPCCGAADTTHPPGLWLLSTSS